MSNAEKSGANAPIESFVIAYSDSAFSNPHSVVSPETPLFDPNAFTFVGKEMDGLESRRHKTVSALPDGPGFDYNFKDYNWFEIGLKQRCEVDRVHISTKWFTGNQVQAVSVFLKDDMTGKEVQVLDRVDLRPDSDHEFVVPKTVATECHVHCFYDGGITRVHLFGKPVEQMAPRENVLEKAKILDVSNQHYGKPEQAIAGNRQVGHMLGWESARTGFGERALFQLSSPTTIDEVVVDTYMHVYNSPLSCHVFALDNNNNPSAEELLKKAPRWKIKFRSGKEVVPDDIRSYIQQKEYLSEPDSKDGKFNVVMHVPDGSPWKPILPFGTLSRDTLHRFRKLEPCEGATHVLFMYFPNGGIHGLRMHGQSNK